MSPLKICNIWEILSPHKISYIGEILCPHKFFRSLLIIYKCSQKATIGGNGLLVVARFKQVAQFV